MSGRLVLVADDYGLSPAVSEGIRALIATRRLSGTGCMTLFPEWQTEAALLREAPGIEDCAVGLHLTLTDFAGLTRWSLDGNGRMPALKGLIAAVSASRAHDASIAAELDAQLAAFEAAWGAPPAYLDGHQHVHFLRPVRHWLAARAGHFAALASRPWLRGAPTMAYAEGAALKAKVGFVGMLARGFDKAMRAAGYPVRGPLAGFYDWRQPESFAPALDRWMGSVPAGTLVMCHPGGIDDTLRGRDGLVEAREVERDTLLARDSLAMKVTDR